ncbi:DUF222 domain-containing protein [uncultured Nocardioides sp.]|uniref:DUF222 domain-containing protein n=1 Tax=uncultured Nocardioides sp. TaxID=198441 RepID=UPI00260A9C2E|nr:DUF222 domain-containing protein [uncultured Nocardioides sp.]
MGNESAASDLQQRASALLSRFAYAALDEHSDRDLVDLLRATEELKSAAAALQARAAATMAARDDCPAGRRSAGSQVGLARRESPYRGRELTSFATRLTEDLPRVLDALTFGRLNERRAMVLAAELADLSPEHRAEADERLAGNPSTLDGLGDLALRRAARRVAYELDPEAPVRRRQKARTTRRVSSRLSFGDGMSTISGWVEDLAAAAIMTSLRDGADRILAQDDPDDDRTHAQIVADLFVSRLTNQKHAQATPVAVKLLVSAETLLGDEDTPADVEHIGPVPASVARQLVGLSPDLRSTIQRFFVAAGSGTLVAMESGARGFTGQLRDFVLTRDRWTCRTPYCDAPARHVDHPVPVAEGGETSAPNSGGACAGCNYTKEHPGWTYTPVPRWPADPRPHELEIVTPTGHVYRALAPPGPRPPPTPEPRRIRWDGPAKYAA